MNRRKFLTSTAALAVIPIPQRQYRISGYTAEPHGWATEIVRGRPWEHQLKEIENWVLAEEWDGSRWVSLD